MEALQRSALAHGSEIVHELLLRSVAHNGGDGIFQDNPDADDNADDAGGRGEQGEGVDSILAFVHRASATPR